MIVCFSSLEDQDMYSKYDQEEFEGIGDMEKTSHSMKDPLIIHTVNQAYCLNLLRMKSAGYMLSTAVWMWAQVGCAVYALHITLAATIGG